MIRTAAALLLLTSITTASAAEVHVFAAASLTDAVKAVAAGYEHATGDRVIVNFAGSSTLARQIEEGAPADVFLSADEQTMDRLQRRNLIDGASRVRLLSNTLVIVVPRDDPRALSSVHDLVSSRYAAIAVAQPDSVPAGIYAREYLTRTGVWKSIRTKVIPTENVRAALAAVESGDVDAAIVYRTDAMISKRVRIAYQVPRAEGPAISYPFAIVSGSRQNAAARRFLRALTSASAKKTFAHFGFELVP